ncbi:MAG: DUF4411 family protein [Candidatus Nitrosocaldaceae archaeon]
MVKLDKTENMPTIHIYIIDTSSLIDLIKWYPRKNFKSLWGKVEELITNNRLKAPIQVFNEVNRGDDELTSWCEKWKDKLFDNLNTIKYVEQITNKYPNLSKINKRYKDECADPYIIALAKYYKEQSTFDDDRLSYRKPIVISEESNRKEHSLTTVCEKEDIETISISKLATKEGWIF